MTDPTPGKPTLGSAATVARIAQYVRDHPCSVCDGTRGDCDELADRIVAEFEDEHLTGVREKPRARRRGRPWVAPRTGGYTPTATGQPKPPPPAEPGAAAVKP